IIASAHITARIDHTEDNSIPFGLAVMSVTRGTCRGVRYRLLALDQPVEERALAHIGSAYYRYDVAHFLSGELGVASASEFRVAKEQYRVVDKTVFQSPLALTTPDFNIRISSISGHPRASPHPPSHADRGRPSCRGIFRSRAGLRCRVFAT